MYRAPMKSRFYGQQTLNCDLLEGARMSASAVSACLRAVGIPPSGKKRKRAKLPSQIEVRLPTSCAGETVPMLGASGAGSVLAPVADQTLASAL